MVVRTMEDLNDYMLLHGHKTLGDFELSDELTSAVCEINEIEVPLQNGTRFNYISEFKMRKNAKEFFNDYYKLHNVGYLPDKKLYKLVKSKKIASIEDIIEEYNNAAKMVSPFKLPINYNINNVNGGTLITQALVTEDHEYFEQLLPYLNLYFTGINLSKSVTDITTSSYIHEITHSQIESHKTAVDEFHNAEVLSIFNELFYAYKHDITLFDFLLMNRLNGIFMSFNSIYTFKTSKSGKNIIEGRDYTEFDYHTDIKYLTSTLKALKLLSCYIDKKPNTSFITHQISRVFEGQRTVEDCLSDLNVTLENSMNPDNIKKLIRI